MQLAKDPDTAEDLSGVSIGLFFIFCPPPFLSFLLKWKSGSSGMEMKKSGFGSFIENQHSL